MSLVKTEQTYKLQLLRPRLRKSQHSCRFYDQGIPGGQAIGSRERTSSTKRLSFSPSILDLLLSAAPFSSTLPPLLATCHQVLSRSLLCPALLARITAASSQGFHFQFHAPYLHWSDLLQNKLGHVVSCLTPFIAPMALRMHLRRPYTSGPGSSWPHQTPLLHIFLLPASCSSPTRLEFPH